MKEKIKIIVCGCCGKMGSLILQLALKKSEFDVVSVIEKKGHPDIGKEVFPGIIIKDDLEKVAEGKEVIIDFTSPVSTIDFLKIAEEKENPVVIGTTGFTKEQIDFIKETSKKIPILISPNMSFGVNYLFEIINFAAKLLKKYEVEIIETHHHNKKDAPSGTAKKISEIICNIYGKNPEKVLKYGRKGFTGEREKDEIGIHSIRIGNVVGEHTVLFGGEGEIIEISHRCFDRSAFAIGALESAKFIYRKKPGLYSIKEVINDRNK